MTRSKLKLPRIAPSRLFLAAINPGNSTEVSRVMLIYTTVEFVPDAPFMDKGLFPGVLIWFLLCPYVGKLKSIGAGVCLSKEPGSWPFATLFHAIYYKYIN